MLGSLVWKATVLKHAVQAWTALLHVVEDKQASYIYKTSRNLNATSQVVLTLFANKDSDYKR